MLRPPSGRWPSNANWVTRSRAAGAKGPAVSPYRFASTLRPSAVILSQVTSIVRSPARMLRWSAIASPFRPAHAAWSGLNVWALRRKFSDRFLQRGRRLLARHVGFSICRMSAPGQSRSRLTYWITSSARTSSPVGNSIPSAFAVLRLRCAPGCRPSWGYQVSVLPSTATRVARGRRSRSSPSRFDPISTVMEATSHPMVRRAA
jgi:hypothetical protein